MKLIREYYHAFTAAGGRARFELFHGIPGNGHLTGGDRSRINSWQLSTRKGPEALPQFCAFQVDCPLLVRDEASRRVICPLRVGQKLT
jgi:hypothetical protein